MTAPYSTTVFFNAFISFSLNFVAVDDVFFGDFNDTVVPQNPDIECLIIKCPDIISNQQYSML